MQSGEGREVVRTLGQSLIPRHLRTFADAAEGGDARRADVVAQRGVFDQEGQAVDVPSVADAAQASGARAGFPVRFGLRSSAAQRLTSIGT